MLLALTALALGIAHAGAWVAIARPRALSREQPADYRADVLALIVLLIATIGFFWRIIFSAQVWRPAGGGDLAQFLYPTYLFAAESLRRGELPLWNPYLFGGMPFVGDIQSGILYPFNLLTFLLANPFTFRDMEFLSIFHFFFAGAGMYLLLRFGKFADHQLAGLACLAGAVAFEFSDLFIIHFGNLNLIAVASWLPLVFLFFRLAIIERRASFAALAGMALTLSFFAGHIQPFLFIVLVLALYALYEVFVTRQVFPITKYLGLTLVLTILLSAPSLLPALEMTGQTVRENFSYEQAVQFSLAPAQLIGLIMPGFFGRAPAQAWGPWDRVEVGYLGILPLALALIAFVARPDSLTRFLALLAVIGFALALGGYAIPQGWLYQFVPGFNQLRAPARFIFVADFALALLAALGFDLLAREFSDAQAQILRRITQILPWVTLIIAVAAGGTAYAILALSQNQDPVLFARNANAVNALVFFIVLLLVSTALIVARRASFFNPRAWSALALAFIFFDLFSLGAYVDLGSSDPTLPFQHDDVAQFLRSDTSVYRIDSRTDVEGAWPPDTAIVYKFQDLTGDNPLVLSSFNAYWEALGSRSTALYDLLNSKYVIAHPTTPLDAKFKRVFDGQGGISVYENTKMLPRAFVVYASQRAADSTDALAKIHAPQFDPSAVVVLEGANARELSSDGSTGDIANITRYAANEIELQVNAQRDGYLFLDDVYYPGWRAFVDGRETEILRADSLFRAVAISAGAHQITFVYDPLTWRAGIILSLLALVGLIGWGTRKRKNKGEPAILK